jgi:hypothetical protein
MDTGPAIRYIFACCDNALFVFLFKNMFLIDAMNTTVHTYQWALGIIYDAGVKTNNISISRGAQNHLRIIYVAVRVHV